MKNRVFQFSLVVLSILGLIRNPYAQTISNHFFGQNAWMPDTIGDSKACADPPCILYGKLYKHWGTIKNSNASIIRFGGIAADKNKPTNYQYIRMIDSIRANGMEPIIQVPFYKNRYTAQEAADIVKYINITRGQNIKYWIIANEPDLSYSYSNSTQIATYFKPFATAMKNIDPSIKIIGPEIASFSKNIMNGLTTPNGPDDITGKDGNGRYYLDIISFHSYPFNGSQNRSDVISKLTALNSFQDHLIYLNARVASCNSAHGRTGAAMLKTAVTEANINWQNNPSDNLSGTGANSFIGGQFWAEMMGICMKYSVDFINFWSVIEGSSVTGNLGYYDNSNGTKKPTYYHFKLLAENFKGNYLYGTTNQANVKSFGSQDPQKVAVMILNQDQNSYNYTVRLNPTGIVGNSQLKINITAGIASEYTDAIPGESSILLTFNSTGKIIKKCEYSLSGNAMLNHPPTCTEFIPTSVTTVPMANATSNFDIQSFPNPSDGKFTIDLSQENDLGKNYEVGLINLIGQEVYKKDSPFLHGKQEIDLDPSIAGGVYILRVRDKELEKTATKKILVEK